jgi:hypothetical protein
VVGLGPEIPPGRTPVSQAAQGQRCCPAHKKMLFGDRRRFESGRDQLRGEGLRSAAAN